MIAIWQTIRVFGDAVIELGNAVNEKMKLGGMCILVLIFVRTSTATSKLHEGVCVHFGVGLICLKHSPRTTHK